MTTSKLQRLRTAADLGSLVRQERKRQGMSIEEAAPLLGVGRRFLSELERGKGTVELDKALRVLRGLGLGLVVLPSPEADQLQRAQRIGVKTAGRVSEAIADETQLSPCGIATRG